MPVPGALAVEMQDGLPTIEGTEPPTLNRLMQAKTQPGNSHVNVS